MREEWKNLDTDIRARVHPTRKHGMKPDQYFVIRYSVRGVKKQEALGWSSEGWTLAKARAELARLKEAHRTGQGEVTLHAKREKAQADREAEEARQKAEAVKDLLTFTYVFHNGYSTYQENNGKKAKTLRDEEGVLRNHTAPFFAETPLYAVDLKVMDSFVAYLNKKKSPLTHKPLSDASKRHCLALISQLFNYAISRMDDTLQNPVKLTKKPRSDNRRVRWLSTSEAKELLVALAERSQDMHDVALLSIFCGLRLGEVLSLRWGNVNFDERTLHIKEQRTRAVVMPI